jgi:hypothetical protein
MQSERVRTARPELTSEVIYKYESAEYMTGTTPDEWEGGIEAGDEELTASRPSSGFLIGVRLALRGGLGGDSRLNSLLSMATEPNEKGWWRCQPWTRDPVEWSTIHPYKKRGWRLGLPARAIGVMRDPRWRRSDWLLDGEGGAAIDPVDVKETFPRAEPGSRWRSEDAQGET